MNDTEKLELYRQALSQLVHMNGGHLKLPMPDEVFMENGGSLMSRPTEDGGIEFRYVQDQEPH